VGTRTKPQVGILGTKEHCDTFFRDPTRCAPNDRSRSDEQLYQAMAMPQKEFDFVVCAIFDSIVRALQSGDKVEIRGFGSFHTRQRRGCLVERRHHAIERGKLRPLRRQLHPRP
jgi:hypothetical protein